MNKNSVRQHSFKRCYLLLFLTLAMGASMNAAVHVDVEQRYGRLPLEFEDNAGQVKSEKVRFLVHRRSQTVFLEPSGLTLRYQYRASEEDDKFLTDTVHLSFVGARRAARMEGRVLLPGRSNYFIGSDPSGWLTDIPQYQRVRTEGLYPGIAADFYGENGRFEYDLLLAPSADPSVIQLQFEGMASLEINPSGDLILRLQGGDLTHEHPKAYQVSGGQRQPVEVRYRLLGEGRVGLLLGPYDKSLPLVVDPSFIYSSRFGGSRIDQPNFIAIDSSGAAYIAGITQSLDLPLVVPIQSQFHNTSFNPYDAFVSKLNATGTALLYSTYLGGSGDDDALGLAVDNSGSAYVTGNTLSVDFPTSHAIQTTYSGGGDAFLAKLTPTGNAFVYSTFVGGIGGDYASAIAVDATGAVYLGGATGSPDFPVKNAYQPQKAGGLDAFLLKINPPGTALVFSTFFGGSSSDGIGALALEASTGNIAVFGGTHSSDLPTLHAFQGSQADADYGTTFVAKFNPTATALIYSSYLGGSNQDINAGLALDSAGNSYVTGVTGSLDFPTTSSAILPAFPGNPCYVAKISSVGNLVAATFLGGHYGAYCSGIAVDSLGNILVAGRTSGYNYPLFAALLQPNIDIVAGSAFVTKLSPDLSSIIYSTSLASNSVGGAIVLDSSDNAFVTVLADVTYPVVAGSAIGPANGDDVGVSKIVDDVKCAATTVTPLTFTFDSAGGNGTVHVSAPATCSWNVVQAPITDPTMSGPDTAIHSGSGDVSFTVQGTSRGPTTTGYFVIAGKRVAVTQTGHGCSYAIGITSKTFSAGITDDSEIVSTNEGCIWNAQSNASWIVLTPGPYSGYGNFRFTVFANPGPPRTGIITAAGLTFTVIQQGGPVLGVTKSHSGNFAPGQQNATYTITVSNVVNGGTTTGTVTATETLPSGETLVSMSGPGWSCSSNVCSRSDGLIGGSTYPDITVQVNVAPNVTSALVNTVSVSGGGSANATGTDSAAVSGSAPSLSLSRKSLNFGYNGSGITSPQTVVVTFSGGSGLPWTALSNQPNITVFPATGSGNGALQITASPTASGRVTVIASGALNSRQDIQVNVNSATSILPFGSFDTPANAVTGVVGAIPVTGWALDQTEITHVDILREPVKGEGGAPGDLIFIGTAVFVADARPDVAVMFPSYPYNYRAGWGYQMLTNFLPSSSGVGPPGNGTYKIHVRAFNNVGVPVDLGTKTITVDNAHATKPFGTIDTPAQGGTISGTDYVNFGWALTPQSGLIPKDGSTITVVIDGVQIGHPTYDQFRSDVATLFPGLANSGGAVGFFHINPSTLANGVHTISWNVFDNLGRGEGLGSRYFNVLNTGSGGMAVPEGVINESVAREGVRVRHGLSVNHQLEAIKPDSDGGYSVTMEEVGFIELQVGAASGVRLANGETLTLPTGSTLKGGVFYWQPGPGFLGEYTMQFERPDGTRIPVRLKIVPKKFSIE